REEREREREREREIGREREREGERERENTVKTAVPFISHTRREETRKRMETCARQYVGQCCMSLNSCCLTEKDSLSHLSLSLSLSLCCLCYCFFFKVAQIG